ncbi:hypothetical protein G3N95_26310 [Paraburkholderia sp. Tr-20389]|uniref:hypothetical protein n=1 Tax=Paraburkholderia sp. Tr-20389 TaxID=2703903 RepID=UPI001982312D|nr:hypothetical protein [Paraburkholderia sp. Tr-20389]MBN3756477.1 hypothetical protein [Paraburkholderia sp. Tr-20389]
MGTLNALTEWVKHMWPLPLVLAVVVRAVIGYLVNRRAALDRHKLGLEIARLQGDADRAERERIKLELELWKLTAATERRQSGSTVGWQHIDAAHRDGPSLGVDDAASGRTYTSDCSGPPSPSK